MLEWGQRRCRNGGFRTAGEKTEGGGAMGRYFNTEGQCEPGVHYMVNLDRRLEEIKKRYVERGSYFIINRGRQYGKTTTLRLLARELKTDYLVISLDFQELTTANFQDESRFVEGFIRCFIGALKEGKKCSSEEEQRERYTELLAEVSDMAEMFDRLSRICGLSRLPVVLMIDEVDSASNNQVFLDFLALLRRYYLNRSEKPIFRSVILAGVHDIKNLKLKIHSDLEHQYNSPWNIAAKFNLNMAFSAGQIGAMLQEYEEDHHTGMDIGHVAEQIFQYTSGYPYLVSALCKIIDEELPFGYGVIAAENVWSERGVAEAANILLKSDLSLFDSMIKQVDIYKELWDVLEQIIYQGNRIPFSPAEKPLNLGLMFGYLKEENGYIAISNRIFEMYLLNWFTAKEAIQSDAFRQGQRNRNQFIVDGRLDMRQVLQKFVEYYQEVYGENGEEFVESYGRKIFLLYLKPIINGTGNYYLEAQTRDARRTDVIIDYLGERFIVEMKIWHGSEYHKRGERQLSEYLAYYGLKKGYMLSFNFNKKKEIGVKEIRIGDKVIVEAVV